MRIAVFSGVLGPKRQGNQSIKNTLLGYLHGGHEVLHFSIVSNRDESHSYEDLASFDTYRHIGLSDRFMSFLKSANRKKRDTTPRRAEMPKPTEIVDLGISEITTGQIAVAKLYTGFELLRSMFYLPWFRPDMLYGYEIFGARVASILSRLFGVPAINRFQGTYVNDGNREWPPIKYHIKALSGYATGVVMANDGTKGDKVLSSLNVDADTVFFHTNGIDEHIVDFQRNESGVQAARDTMNPGNRATVIGIFNRFYPFKRIDRAIYLAKVLRDQGMDIQLAIGGGGGPLERDLKAFVHECGMQDNVTWLGKVPFESMPAFYTACDVVVVMNDYANTGNQIFESLKLGIPLVAIDDEVNSALFGDCPYALFIEPEHLKSLTVADLEKLMDCRGTKYKNDFLVDWRTRMAREVTWVSDLMKR